MKSIMHICVILIVISCGKSKNLEKETQNFQSPTKQNSVENFTSSESYNILTLDSETKEVKSIQAVTNIENIEKGRINSEFLKTHGLSIVIKSLIASSIQRALPGQRNIFNPRNVEQGIFNGRLFVHRP